MNWKGGEMIHGYHYWEIALLGIFTVGIISGLLQLASIVATAVHHLREGHQQ